MFINEIKTTKQTNNVKKPKNNTSSDSGFFDEIIESAGHAEQASSLSETNQLSNLQNLLFLQEITHKDTEKKEFQNLTSEIFKILEQIQVDLLNHSVSHDKLKQLSGIISHNYLFVDKNLTELLNKIKLRAEVELAKHSKLDINS